MNSEAEKARKVIKQRDRTRELEPGWARIVSVLAIAMSCYQLFFTIFTVPSPTFFRSFHLIFAMLLILFMYPARKGIQSGKVPLYDLLLALIAVVVGVYIVWAYEDLIWRMGNFHSYEIALGVLAIILVLETTRRAVGPPLAIIAGLFILYDLFGKYSPLFAHAGFSLERTVSQLYLTMEGIYGMPLGVMTSFVFLFILFSAFLRKTGAGDFLIDLSFAVMGRFVGGPAKAAAVASGFFGSISGSITANVVGTGSITIPMMRRLGYRPEFAGAVEVASSTGGQLMPPIMGAGAFIMAEWTGIPYSTIILYSLVPAILFYVSVISFIHFNAKRMGIGKVEAKDVPRVRETLRKGWHFVIPVIVLLWYLVRGYSPMMAASSGIVAILAVHFLEGLVRRGPDWSVGSFLRRFWRDFLSALEEGAKGAVVVSAAMACAGIIVGSVGLTGMGLRLSNALISLTAGSLFLTIIFVALASLIMGMEMPVTASYIIVAILAVPALKALGLPILTAHLIVFWFSQDAAVTPPVCLSSYAAAAISGGNPFKTGLQAWKLAKGLYVIPLLFAYTGLLGGSWFEVFKVGAMAFIGFICFAAAWEGYLLSWLNLSQRLALAVTALLCLFPSVWSYLAGILLFAAILAWQRVSKDDNEEAYRAYS